MLMIKYPWRRQVYRVRWLQLRHLTVLDGLDAALRIFGEVDLEQTSVITCCVLDD